MRELPRTITSLDRPVGEDGDASLGDLMAADTPEPTADLELSLRSEALEQALADLPAREALVLRRRFGLGDDEPGRSRRWATRSASPASGCARSSATPCATWRSSASCPPRSAKPPSHHLSPDPGPGARGASVTPFRGA